MADEQSDIFSDEEKDILQEIMNIAFGNATADLAQVIDIYVMLSVPNVEVIKLGELPQYLNEALKDNQGANVVEQKFWGNFKGSALLVFPSNTERDLMSIIEGKAAREIKNIPMASIEKGGLLEIGNILIGACVGKVSELLNTFVTYSPPQVIQSASDNDNFIIEHFDPSQTAIVMKTLFTFKEKNINGFLMILTNHESIDWLRKALYEFLDSYA